MKALLERAKTCRRKLGRIPNLLPVDFYDSGDIVEAVAKLNGARRGRARRAAAAERAG